MRILDDAS